MQIGFAGSKPTIPALITLLRSACEAVFVSGSGRPRNGDVLCLWLLDCIVHAQSEGTSICSKEAGMLAGTVRGLLALTELVLRSTCVFAGLHGTVDLV
jgi:hypothetical protein